MEELPSDRCAYMWPENHDPNDPPFQQSCCWRKTLEGSDRCVWHAPSSEVTKSIKVLREARSSPNVREKNRQSVRAQNEILETEGIGYEQPQEFSELLDGANLSHLELNNEISFVNVALRDSDFTGANISEVDFSGADIRGSDLSDATLCGTKFTGANLAGIDLAGVHLNSVGFVGANFTEANLSGAVLSRADFTGAYLMEADLSGVFAIGANFSDSVLGGSDLSGAELSRSDFSDADLIGAELSGVHAVRTNFSGANLVRANLTDANLKNANLSGADLEHTILIRTNLFDANLTDTKPHGATFTDVQINDNTEFRINDQRSEDARWWQRGPFLPLRRCGYDPVVSQRDEESDTNLLGKAADTYQTFEKLARENARPSLQSEMFVLRQDMQRKRHWHNREYSEWFFARMSRLVFKHGESLRRIVTCAALLIAFYTIIYTQFDLITNPDGQFVSNPVDALYFSTLTFTTLGLGDFQPSPASEFARLLVTSQAAIGTTLIATFVFVLGRRAAK